MSIAATKPGTDAFREQEEIVARELLADGETRGDDRRWMQVRQAFNYSSSFSSFRRIAHSSTGHRTKPKS
jgi:hypothetical protein